MNVIAIGDAIVTMSTIVWVLVDSCKVKMDGDVILSFPVSMIQMLRSNSEPPPLCLKIKNTDNLEDISTNRKLIVEYVSYDVVEVILFVEWVLHKLAH